MFKHTAPFVMVAVLAIPYGCVVGETTGPQETCEETACEPDSGSSANDTGSLGVSPDTGYPIAGLLLEALPPFHGEDQVEPQAYIDAIEVWRGDAFVNPTRVVEWDDRWEGGADIAAALSTRDATCEEGAVLMAPYSTGLGVSYLFLDFGQDLRAGDCVTIHTVNTEGCKGTQSTSLGLSVSTMHCFGGLCSTTSPSRESPTTSWPSRT